VYLFGVIQFLLLSILPLLREPFWAIRAALLQHVLLKATNGNTRN
jgi:hypothetical protein